MAKKTKSNGTDGIDLRQKLTADFVTKLQADWDLHGPEIIEALRTKAPTKYAEIIARFAMPEPMPPGHGDFSQCQTVEEIGIKLLQQVGLSDPREDQITAAVAANDHFIAELQQIAGERANSEYPYLTREEEFVRE